jgi:S1-C subfamily serine protease
MSATIIPFELPKNEAVMSVHSLIPETAMTAQMLGTERESHAVQVSADGLMLTVGYSIMEATEVWITNRKGQTSEGIVLAHDYDSGLALLRPATSLGTNYLETADASTVSVGDRISIVTSENSKAMDAVIFAREQYAGRWEYLLEDTFYTVPLCEHWSGAGLLNKEGKLCAIGSLALGLKGPTGDIVPGNLFIPVDLVTPHLEHMSNHGKKPGALRPWLGTLVEEHDAELCVVGLYMGAPAARAGIRTGDIILSVADQPVSSMAGFFRTLWYFGPAGTRIPLTVKAGNDGETIKEIILDTIDRDSFFIQQSQNMLN